MNFCISLLTFFHTQRLHKKQLTTQKCGFSSTLTHKLFNLIMKKKKITWQLAQCYGLYFMATRGQCWAAVLFLLFTLYCFYLVMHQLHFKWDWFIIPLKIDISLLVVLKIIHIFRFGCKNCFSGWHKLVADCISVYLLSRPITEQMWDPPAWIWWQHPPPPYTHTHDCLPNWYCGCIGNSTQSMAVL